MSMQNREQRGINVVDQTYKITGTLKNKSTNRVFTQTHILIDRAEAVTIMMEKTRFVYMVDFTAVN